MSYMTKLGILAYINEANKRDTEDIRDESQAWFEGFAAGMSEAGAIDEDEYEEILDYLVSFSLRKKETSHEDQKGQIR